MILSKKREGTMCRKIALCIPIYKTYQLAEEFLKEYSASYIQAGIDIYYYDSTPDDSVKKVIDNWVDDEHIYYIEMRSATHSVEKVYQIFQGIGLQFEYEYIWMCNDAVRCSHIGLEKLLYQMKKNFDIITIDVCDTEKNVDCIFTSPNDYVQHCFNTMTLYGSIILNAKTFLKDVDWSKYANIFSTSTQERWWAYISFYCFRILELENFSAIAIPCKSDFVRFSELKKTSQWTSDLFPVLCDGLVNTVKHLPDAYMPKKKLSKGYIENVFLNSIFSFLMLKEEGQYTVRTYWKYRNVWDWVTNRPKWNLFLISLIPNCAVRSFFKIRKKINMKQFKRFYSSHPKIYIYGAGGYGYRYAEYLTNHDYHFEAFCVTKCRPNKKMFCGHPVYEFRELQNNLSGTGVIIALKPGSADKVKLDIQEYISSKDIFHVRSFEKDISHELGYRDFTK